MTVKPYLLAITLTAILTLSGGQPATAQQHISIDGPRKNVLGFSYGWTGGISVGSNGTIQMQEHPRVTVVREGSGAEAAGLLPGDVLLSVNGRDARDPAALRDVEPASRVVITVRRGEERRRVVLTTAPTETDG